MENKSVNYWIAISEYDLKVAKGMLEKRYFLYVGFMCHQAIEKILKAHYVKRTGNVPPYTHKLDRLIKEAGLKEDFSEIQEELIDELTPLNIQARYPFHKDAIYNLLNKAQAGEILRKTEDLWQWLRQKID